MIKRNNEFTYTSFDNQQIFAKSWSVSSPKGIIQIVHGLGEMSDYYEEFAQKANESGFSVYINEARGHGRTPMTESDDIFSDMVKDIYFLSCLIAKQNKNVPIFLLGHSMGSILVQLYAKEYSEYLSGLILTGLPYFENTYELLELADKEIEKRGENAPSVEVFSKMFNNVNEQFEPVSSLMDWITSDKNKIEQYEKLPYTNVLYSNKFYKSFILTVEKAQGLCYLNTIRKDLPIIILSGEKDAVSKNGQYAVKKYNDLYLYGFKNVNYTIYAEMRHSILQEIDRQLVEKDIIDWIYNI